jgi:bifunctional UDP-N-acetylglucosamine pyrophosphorylase / glucosamine-1-phosphate N-acetyltransferase
MKISAVILAAGQGTRMKSSLPKVLHCISGHPMIHYSLQAVAGLSEDAPLVVVGHGADAVRQFVGNGARFVVQEQQLGTAHAVQTAEALLAGKCDLVAVISADMPLLTSATVQKMVEIQQANSGPMTMLIIDSPDSRGFGRIIRDSQGSISAIVEEAQASPEILALTELNVGAYVFRSDWLWDTLKKIQKSPKGEYYVTDTVEIAVREKARVESLTLADPAEAIGVNTRVHLSEAESAMRRRINNAWMLAGVTMIDPATTYIEPEVTIGRDTVLYPNTWMRGVTTVGENCEIGPNAVLANCTVGSRCQVQSVSLQNTVIKDGHKVGN